MDRSSRDAYPVFFLQKANAHTRKTYPHLFFGGIKKKKMYIFTELTTGIPPSSKMKTVNYIR